MEAPGTDTAAPHDHEGSPCRPHTCARPALSVANSPRRLRGRLPCEAGGSLRANHLSGGRSQQRGVSAVGRVEILKNSPHGPFPWRSCTRRRSRRDGTADERPRSATRSVLDDVVPMPSTPPSSRTCDARPDRLASHSACALRAPARRELASLRDAASTSPHPCTAASPATTDETRAVLPADGLRCRGCRSASAAPAVERPVLVLQRARAPRPRSVRALANHFSIDVGDTGSSSRPRRRTGPTSTGRRSPARSSTCQPLAGRERDRRGPLRALAARASRSNRLMVE